MTGEGVWLWLAAGVAFVVIVFLWVVWLKSRPFAPGDVFRASRISSGNRIFPAQVLISPTSVVHYQPQWMGRLEKVIHLSHVSSVKIDTGLLLSDIQIETSGGSDPVKCHGHHKADAVRMKTLIEQYQTDYYRSRTVAPIT